MTIWPLLNSLVPTKQNATHAPESLVRAVEEKKSLDVCLSFLCGNEPQMMIQSEETQ